MKLYKNLKVVEGLEHHPVVLYFLDHFLHLLNLVLIEDKWFLNNFQILLFLMQLISIDVVVIELLIFFLLDL